MSTYLSLPPSMSRRMTSAKVGVALALGVSLLALTVASPVVQAATPKNTLVEVGEHGPNALDPMAPAANELSQMVAWQIFDRLVTHGTKTTADGKVVYDLSKIEPELAESWEISPDKKTIVFHLRHDATFHDGTPVTAQDVKYSFDRAVSVGGFPSIQMAAGSMTKPDQFTAVDDYTFKITFDTPNKLTMPDLTVPVPNIVNAALIKKHATAADPWGVEWTRTNDAGGGPFKVSAWKSGDQIVFQRFDAWKSGPLPKLQKVVYREVASAGTRRALLEKGDVDVSKELPPKDFAELAKAGKVDVIGTPMQNQMLFVDMNVTQPPFNNVKVREALAYAMPYQQILDQAYYDRGEPMWGWDASKPYPIVWPVASPFKTDLAKAKQLLTEAGFPNGFKTDLYIDMSQSTTQEPMALLMQEQFKKIGVDITLNKVPGSDWFAKMGAKTMPMVINYFYGWLDYPEYHFFWTYDGKNNSVFNTADYVNPAMDAAIEAARFETDPDKYAANVREMYAIAMTDVPRIPVVHLTSDVALQKNVKGYVYWFHTNLDYRSMYKD